MRIMSNDQRGPLGLSGGVGHPVAGRARRCGGGARSDLSRADATCRVLSTNDRLSATVTQLGCLGKIATVDNP